MSARLARVTLAALALAVFPLSCSSKKSGVTIQFWQFWDPAVIAPLLVEFEQAHPGIHVEMQQLTWQSGREKIIAALASGTQPDLCELGSTWVARFASDGALQEVSADAAPIRDRYLMWEAITFDGKEYGYPWVEGTRALFYNRALFRAAGLDPDRPPATWDELRSMAQRIHQPEKGTFGIGLNGGERYILFKKFMPFAWGNGGSILTPDNARSVLDSPENREALDFYLSLRPLALLDKQDVLDRAFKEGRLGFNLSGAWNFKSIPVDAPELDYGVALIPKPAVDRGRSASFGGGEVLVVFRGAKHPEEAGALARFLIEPRQALALARSAKSVQPVAIDAANDPNYREHPKEAVFLEQMVTAVFPPNIPEWIEIEDAINEELERALLDQATSAEALRAASARIDAILAPGP